MKLPNLKITRNLSEKVYDYLEEQILTGALLVGARLPTEPELSKGFGVSRTVIREAIQKLKAQGLVISKVGNGSFVASDPMAQIRKVFSHFRQIYANKHAILDYVRLRTLIEVECMRIVGEAKDPKCLQALETIVNLMGDKVSPPTVEEFEQLDMSFHITMAEYTNNIMFQAILEPLKDFSRRTGLRELQRSDFTPNRREALWKEHRELLDMIKEGKVDEATSFFRERMKLTIELFGGDETQSVSNH